MDQVPGQDVFPPTVGQIADSDAPNATNFGVATGGLSDRTQFLYRRVATVPVINWMAPLVPGAATYSPAGGHAPFAPSGNRDNWQAVAFAAERQEWLVAAATAGGTLEVFSAHGNGEGFVIVDAALVNAVPATTIDEIHKLIPSGIGASSADRTVALVVQALGTTHRIVAFTLDVGGVWTASALLDAYGASGVVKRSDGMRSLVAGGFVAGVGVNAGLAAVKLQTSADGITWTDRTSQLAAGISSNCPSWCFAESATRVLAVARGAAQNAYMRSADGVTWTAGTFGVIGGTELVSAIAYGPSDQPGVNQFVVAVANAAGDTRFLRSNDNGVTWTAVAQALTGVSVSDLCCAGATWAAVSEQADRSGTILYSLDGALTWRRTRYGFSDNLAVGSSRYTRPRIAASDTGFVAVNSDVLRFSLEAGLTGQIT